MVGFFVKRSMPEEKISEFLDNYDCVSFEVQGDHEITIELLGSFVEIFTQHAHWNGRVGKFDSIDAKLVKDRMNPSTDEMNIVRKIMRAINKKSAAA